MNTAHYSDLARQVLARVTKAGASGDLIVDSAEALSLKARAGQLEEYKVSSSQIFGLRVIHQGRVGSAYSESSDSQALASMVDSALSNARYTATEPCEKILESTQQLRSDDQQLCPDDNCEIDEKIDFALALEQQLASRQWVKSVPYNGVQDVISSRNIYNTTGLQATGNRRYCSAQAQALVEHAGSSAMAGSGQAVRCFSDLDLASLVEAAHRSAIDIVPGIAVASGRYDVIFDRDVGASLWGVFSPMFSGKLAKDGVNPMRDKLDQPIADPRLTISDMPRCELGLGYQLFDAEGSPTTSQELIVGGRLCSMLHNSATASFFNIASTGHAARGPKSTLDVRPHQLVVAAGTTAEHGELVSGQYLELTGLTGLHSGANIISGDFSFGASGFLCADGQRKQAVRHITVAGNFYKMLNSISMIGDRQHWNWQRSMRSPLIRFSKLAISG